MTFKTITSACLLAGGLIIGIIVAQQVVSQAQAENPLQNGSGSETKPAQNKVAGDAKQMGDENLETATFGGGCFWCVEAVFQSLKGVDSVTSGYMGGHTENPTYKAICTGTTGHAEITQIKYDPSVITFADLLQVFWKTHDPTTLNRQGYDVGTQYRSVVFYHDDTQKELAEKYKKKLNESGAFGSPIVTEVSAATTFYPAEKYHQDYWNTQGQSSRYCQALIPPKLEKLKAAFADKVKDN